MIERVHVIGSGRVGSAAAARLGERGVAIGDQAPDLVLLCVPDRAIASVAATLPTGPWIAHVSGAAPLAALGPHARRFGVHPLQTFNTTGDPTQFDDAWAALTCETPEALAPARWLAETLGLRPFELAESDRALYHAGAAVASNFLVTLFRASRLAALAQVPPEALVPLMRRTLDNGFELTGPIARGDWATVDAHLAAIHSRAPELEALYRVLAEATTP